MSSPKPKSVHFIDNTVFSENNPEDECLINTNVILLYEPWCYLPSPVLPRTVDNVSDTLNTYGSTTESTMSSSDYIEHNPQITSFLQRLNSAIDTVDYLDLGVPVSRVTGIHIIKRTKREGKMKRLQRIRQNFKTFLVKCCFLRP